MIITNPGLDDAELVRQVSLKSRVGAEVLYDRYAKVLWLVIIRVVHEKKEAEDVLEKTYVKAWNSFNLYNPQIGKLLPWMMIIARNLAKDTVKGKIILIRDTGQSLKRGKSRINGRV